jgi:hypothetical protein
MRRFPPVAGIAAGVAGTTGDWFNASAPAGSATALSAHHTTRWVHIGAFRRILDLFMAHSVTVLLRIVTPGGGLEAKNQEIRNNSRKRLGAHLAPSRSRGRESAPTLSENRFGSQ